jgi:hypothetical protein
MTDEERVEQVCIYRSPIRQTPRKRLGRIADGLVWAVQSKQPAMSEEMARAFIGLVLSREKDRLVAEALQR